MSGNFQRQTRIQTGAITARPTIINLDSDDDDDIELLSVQKPAAAAMAPRLANKPQTAIRQAQPRAPGMHARGVPGMQPRAPGIRPQFRAQTPVNRVAGGQQYRAGMLPTRLSAPVTVAIAGEGVSKTGGGYSFSVFRC